MATPGVLPPGSRPTNTKRARIIALLVFVVLAVAFWFLSSGSHSPSTKFADSARVGDCVEKSGSGDDVVLKVVECSSSEAEYKVAIRRPAGDRCPEGFSEYEKTRGSLVTLRLCLVPAGN
ncbi:LppU/SCO3897 family protein [Streptomyces noursei]|uniref:LppU/SCO3897 family protein n=1 Tax=Streptomyces noursei TaxID=1971 RepID=UPI00406BA138